MDQQWGVHFNQPHPSKGCPPPLPQPSLAIEVRDILDLLFPAGRQAHLSLELLIPINLPFISHVNPL